MKMIDEIRQQVAGNKPFYEQGQLPLPHNMMSKDAYEIATTLLATIQNLEGALHVVSGARDVLMSKDKVLTELAEKVCIMSIDLEQHAEYVDELKAFLEANEDNET